MTRKNLVQDPSFHAGTDHVVALNSATISLDSDYAFYGDQSLKIEKSADNNSGIATTDNMPVTAGLSYAASVYARLPVTIPAAEIADVVLRVEWRNASNAVISTVESGLVSLIADSWTRISGVWIAPVGAVSARLQVAQPEGGSAGEVFYIDAMLFEQSNYVGGYLDNISLPEELTVLNKALAAPIPQNFQGMQLNADIQLNDLIFNTVDEDGVLWVCNDLDGWWGQTSPELPDIPRGVEDGSYDVSGRYQARMISLNGVFYPPNAEALGAARDKLVAATNLVRQGAWLRTNEGPTKAAFVRLSGRPLILTTNDRGRTEFSIGLRAADPIKYHWNDQDADGYSTEHLDAVDETGEVENIGTAPVTALFMITGPMGAGSTIYNSATDETITIISALRGAGAVGTITLAGVTSNIATLTTSAPHHLLAGDEIIISGAGSPYDSVGTTYTVLAAAGDTADDAPYTFSFALPSDDLEEVEATGSVQLANNDTLLIDTYNQTVTYNAENIGQRSKLETLTDWIKLAPGENLIEFHDAVTELEITNKQIDSGVATLTADDAHFFVVGETVDINLAETALLSKKSLTSNVVTLTTLTPHGFTVGDQIDVDSTEQSIVNAKEISSNVATLTTVDSHGISVADTVVVALPATATPTEKSLTSNVATIKTQNAHGFSVGDSVTVALATAANVTNKALTSNQATLTTATAHNFAVGDSITVNLPTPATITNKARSGASAILTTTGPHGFASGDTITVAFPTTATLTDTRSIDGPTTYLVTLNTSGAHGFVVGDSLTVNIGVTDTFTVSNRVATSTDCTLTIPTHGWSVGEKITVTGVSARYNGTFYITSTTGTTVTYDNAGATESSTASSGSITNNTIASYYNGSGKIIESVPSSTSFTYLAYSQGVATTSTATGTSPVLTNDTSVSYNGTKTLIAASGTSLTYNF